MNLRDFSEAYGIELRVNFVVRGVSLLNRPVDLDDVYKYSYNECGHTYTKSLRSIARDDGNCSKCHRVYNFEQRYRITVDFEGSKLKCLECERVFNREPNKLLYNIGLFKCICKLKSIAERELYDLLYGRFPDELYRNYLYENPEKKNYTGDFYLKCEEDETIIIALDDCSHRGPKNRENDKYKMGLIADKDNVYTIHLQQDMLEGNIGWILDELDVDDLPKVRLYGAEDMRFYEYMIDYLELNEIDYEYIEIG